MTFKQQLLMIIPAFLTFSVLGFLYIYTTKNSIFLLYFGLGIFIIDTLPALIPHIQYYLKNKDSYLIIDQEKNIIILKTKGTTIQTSLNDIIELQHYASYGGGTGFYAMGEYRFYRLVLNGNKDIIITCLMVNDIENTLEPALKMKAKKIMRLVCFLPPIGNYDPVEQLR